MVRGIIEFMTGNTSIKSSFLCLRLTFVNIHTLLKLDALQFYEFIKGAR